MWHKYTLLTNYLQMKNIK
ncbi:hypothetical protein IQ31_02250 [Sphingobacterium siyangense]|uniref:Uncharacterized protein n=1 Tax=Sphingobacterium siyangense TaxID=459529 RepID=A0A562MK95_9SPHI|nr:hypothetical protein IQ31_02250 [Sphingobacterium siyangense]